MINLFTLWSHGSGNFGGKWKNLQVAGVWGDTRFFFILIQTTETLFSDKHTCVRQKQEQTAYNNNKKSQVFQVFCIDN